MRIKQHLERLKDKALQICLGPEEKEEKVAPEVNDNGVYSHLQFKQVQGLQIRFVFTNSKRPPITIEKVAVSTPRKQYAEFNVPKILRAQTLMRQHEITSAHIHGSMFIGKGGIRISPAARSDLFDHTIAAHEDREKILTFEQLQRLFGQILVGVAAFRQKNTVHRDLKPENILVFESINDQGKIEYLVKICDHDCVAEVEAKTGQPDSKLEVTGSPHYVPPEVILKGYTNIDLFKADSYACGEILQAALLPITKMDPTQEKLVEALVSDLKKWPHSGSDNAEMLATVEDPETKIMKPDKKYDGRRQECFTTLQNSSYSPAKRISVEKAKENKFFGTKDKTPPQFFEQLENDFAHEIEVNGVPVDPNPAVDDPGNLLPAPIKALYDHLASIDEEKPAPEACQKAIQMIDAALENPELKNYQEELNPVRSELRYKIADMKLAEIDTKDVSERLPIYSSIFQGLPLRPQSSSDHKKSADLLQKMSSKLERVLFDELPRTSSNRKAYEDLHEKIEKRRLQLLTPQTLIDATKKAVEQFILLNNLSVRKTVIGSKTVVTQASKFVSENPGFNLKTNRYTSYGKFCCFFPNPTARHGQAGLERAAALYYEMLKLLPLPEQENNSVKNREALRNMYEKSQQHLSSGEGNWSAHSFKTLLAAELSKLSTLSHEVWEAQLCPQPKKSVPATFLAQKPKAAAAAAFVADEKTHLPIPQPA